MAKIFSCQECAVFPQQKVKYGCMSPTKEPVWYTDECFKCHGTDMECEDCEGSNKMSVFRCPRALAATISRLLPFFFDWRVSNRIVWPNGGPRIKQPVKLSMAFDLLNEFVTMRETSK